MTTSYRQLIVWQKSIELVELIYKLTQGFPKAELFGLVSQIRRAAISIPSNIAEGYGRRSDKEYLQFYSFSYGSALELETQLFIAQKLGFGEKAFKGSRKFIKRSYKNVICYGLQKKGGQIEKSE